jgi:hypothetical protein
MALVPYTVTALAESDAEGTSGKNIVAGAVVIFYDGGVPQTLYDNAAGLNPDTAKATDSTGQVTIYIEQGVYDVEVNGGTQRGVSVSGNDSLLGTASLSNVTTSATDTTAGRVTKVGDNGIGSLGTTGYPIASIDSHTCPSGIYTAGSSLTGTYPSGFNIFGTIFVERYDANTIKQTFYDVVQNRAAVREVNNTGVQPWQEFWTTGNTNFNTFGGVAAEDILAQGSVRTPTVAQFVLPISLLAAPSSITVTGTFKIIKPDLAVVATAVVPTLNSASGNKVAFLTFTISGGVANDVLLLKCTDATSKIVVNA